MLPFFATRTGPSHCTTHIVKEIVNIFSYIHSIFRQWNIKWVSDMFRNRAKKWNVIVTGNSWHTMMRNLLTIGPKGCTYYCTTCIVKVILNLFSCMHSIVQYHIKLDSNMFRSRAKMQKNTYYWTLGLLHNSFVKLYADVSCCVNSVEYWSAPCC